MLHTRVLFRTLLPGLALSRLLQYRVRAGATQVVCEATGG